MLDRIRARPWVAPVLVASVAMLVYANAMAGGFIYDDDYIIEKNHLVQSIDGVWRAFTLPWWHMLPGQEFQYRPLTIASFSVDWALSGGSPRWFHFINVVWHAAASVLVWVLARRWTNPAAALLAALLFAVHPLHVEAVANTVGRAEVMATVFVLAALLLHVRRSLWAVPLFLLALFSKENAITFWALAFFADVLLEPRSRDALRERRWLYAGYAAATVIFFITLQLVFGDRPLLGQTLYWEGIDPGNRVLTAISLVPDMVRLHLFPVDLSADYTPQVRAPLSGVNFDVVAGIVILAGAAWAIVRCWRRAPVVAFGLLWFAAAFSPVSNVLFPTGVILAERTFYLPSVGPLLAAAVGLEALLRMRPALGRLAAGLALVLLVARTWTRTPVWKDWVSLVVTTLTDHPESSTFHFIAGNVYAARGDRAAAAREYDVALTLYGRDPRLWTAAAANMTFLDVARASAMLDSALARSPDDGLAQLGQADARYRLGDFRRALVHARAAQSLLPDSARAVLVEAFALRAAGDHAGALAAYRAGLVRHPRDWMLHAGLADVLLEAGDPAAALAAADQAVRLSGSDSTAVAIQRRIAGRTGSGRVQETVQ